MIFPTSKEIEEKIKVHFGKIVIIEVKENIFFRIFGIDLIIPKGLKSDGNSFPFFLKAFISPFNPKWLFAGLVHDYFYRTQFLPRHIADSIYREILKKTAGKFTAFCFYKGVDWGGYFAYKENGKKLIKFPNAKHDLKVYLCKK